ncbi:hypothetical protein N7513_009780 [Penicillium frequentans]|nr:hypothetical protein N7513_009780 [Penicillium glabrum]
MCAGRLASLPAVSSRLLLPQTEDTHLAMAFSVPAAHCNQCYMDLRAHRRADPSHNASKVHFPSTLRAAHRGRATRSHDLHHHDKPLHQSHSLPHHHHLHLRPRAVPTSAADHARMTTATQTWADVTVFPHPNAVGKPPYNLPLGLSSTDFYSLHSPPVTQSPPSPAQRLIDARIQESAPINPDAPLPSIELEESTPASSDWTAEEDQQLMDLVLEKFRLSQQEWDECARRMGRSHQADLGQRWNSLVGEGRVGLRPARQ